MATFRVANGWWRRRSTPCNAHVAFFTVIYWNYMKSRQFAIANTFIFCSQSDRYGLRSTKVH
jgi:hypothetical protein